MGVTTYTHEVATSVAAPRMFKALFVDSHNLLPKVIPQTIKSIEIVQGDGGDGCIKKTNYLEDGTLKYGKHKFEVVDIDNLVCKYSLIEGDVMVDKVEIVYYEAKFEVSGNGGCVCKTTCKFHTKGDYALKEEEIKEGVDKAMELFKVVEQYLLANPSVYA
nr:pathogenesis-related protein STH-2-like [Ipomoea trifida]GMC92000.1 pathogenesis-related protein STH-2-like [Ipomoea batatas]GMC99738.1 pathogenesis-related protein STH-2-like [Ipomoea batatas]GME18107.1 pathogenesis-related protein STH-2-like [Ipomoea batatas]